MRSKKLLNSCVAAILVSFILFGQQAKSQNLTKVIPPSPDAQAMQKYGDIPVGTYTGVPDINIPLYTIKFHDITLPISLSYHASGVKVQEEASNVGLGWVLNAGGIISRNIVEEDDLYSQLTYFNTGTFAADGTFSPTSNFVAPMDFDGGLHPDKPIMQGDCIVALLDATGHLQNYNVHDFLFYSPIVRFQPDQYYYSFPGSSGKFVLDRSYNAILEKQDKVQIRCMNADGSSWQIKSVDGFTYEYATYETSNDIGEVVKHRTAWYLTKITSPTGSVISYTYVGSGDFFSTTAGELTENRDIWTPLTVSHNVVPPLPSGANITPGKVYSVIRLSSIDYDGGRIVFSYLGGDATTRADLPYGYKLSQMNVFTKDSQGTLSTTALKTFDFTYDYFSGIPGNNFNNNTSTTGPNVKRLKLLSVKESGNYNGQTASSNPYNFSYYDSGPYNSLPDKSSYARDYWGYFNGNTSLNSLIPSFLSGFDHVDPKNFFVGIPGSEHNSNSTFMQAGSLQTIQYPTGGTTTFEYEANDCDEQASEVNDHSGNSYLYSVVPSPMDASHPNNFIWYSTGTNSTQVLDNSNVYQDPSGNRIDGTFSISFRLNGSQPVFNTFPVGYATVSFVNQATGQSVHEWDPGNYPLYTSEPTSAPTTGYVLYTGGIIQIKNLGPLWNLAPGKYTWVVSCNTTTTTEYSKYIVSIGTNYTWYTQVNSNPGYNNAVTYSQAGGLRIRRITDHDGINPDKVRKYIYHYTADKNGDGVTEEYSYGKRMSRPEYSYFENEAVRVLIRDLETHQVTQQFDEVAEHLMRTSDSNIALDGSAGGSVVGYDQVTELFGENGENGKKIYKYNNQPDYVGPYFIQGALQISDELFRRRPYNSNIPNPLNGTLLEEQDFENTGIAFSMVKDLLNNYVTNPATENVLYAFEDRLPLASTIDYGSRTAPPSLDNCNRFFYTYSPVQSEWPQLVSTTEKIFGLSDPTKFAQKTTNFYYDNPQHLQPTREVVVNSKGQTITTTITYPLDYTPVSTTDAVSKGIKNLITNHIINAEIEKSVQKSDTHGSNTSVVSSTLTSYSDVLPLPSQVYLMQSASPVLGASFGFLSKTNPLTPPIATSYYKPAAAMAFDNATGNILRQSKNLDVTNSYHWGYKNQYPIAQCINANETEFYFEGFEENTSALTGTGHTGSKYSNNTTVSWTRPNSRSYVISYWRQTGTGPWQYSGEVSYTTNSFTLTGGTNFDDIRIYPNDAQMSTFTYDPMVGMTSTTDAKGLTNYFEYDGLLRLINVKDKDGNITKNFNYNFAH